MRHLLFPLLMLFLVIIGEAYTYAAIRSVVRNLNPFWKNTILVVYILVSVLVWFFTFFARKLDWSQVPTGVKNAVIVFTVGFMLSKVLVLLVMLIDDMRRLVLYVMQQFSSSKNVETATQRGIPRSMFIKQAALIIGGLALGGSFLSMRNRYNYKVRNAKIKYPNLPKAFDGLKIVQISDIHSGSFDSIEAVHEGIRKINELKPDIIFFTGDLVNNLQSEIIPYKAIFSELRAPMGVYSILGNHDYGEYVHWDKKADKVRNLDELKQHHADMGWRLLLNEHVILEKDNEKIALIGVENWSAKPQFPKYGKLAEAYAGLEKEAVPFKILLSHDPSHWDAEVLKKYPDIDLTLSGHTHGMQFGVEIPGFKWSPVQYVYRQWAGLYREAQQYLYVNRGYGFLGYPGRVGILAEITEIDLSA